MRGPSTLVPQLCAVGQKATQSTSHAGLSRHSSAFTANAFTAAAGAAAVGVLTLLQAYKHRLRPACKVCLCALVIDYPSNLDAHIETVSAHQCNRQLSKHPFQDATLWSKLSLKPGFGPSPRYCVPSDIACLQILRAFRN